MVSKASPQCGGGWKASYCHACPMRYIYIYIYMPYVRNLRVHGRYSDLTEKRKWTSLETRHRYARFVGNDEENGCNS